MITARDFYDKHESDNIVVMMIDFAKMHVKEALSSAHTKIVDDAVENYGTSRNDCWNKDSILNAYPLENIK